MKRVLSTVAALTLLLLSGFGGFLHADIGYQFVTVGNAGNADDTVPASDGSGLFFGGVTYIYSMGKYDVTLNQYAAFLNAVAQTDPYGLYNPSLATDPNVAGITRSGSSGTYAYSVTGDGSRPVTYIGWFDAARMANWMHNGQPSGLGEVAGTTEQGAYSLNGATSGVVLKNAGALVWIPSESEWYKAAYYDPALNAGAGGYWSYATKSNSAPGNVIGSSTNQANYHTTVYSVSQSGTFPTGNALTDVGAFANSASAYGTFDQNGDVWNWNDAVISSSSRGIRGASWASSAASLQSSFRSVGDPAGEDNRVGFRLATVAPILNNPGLELPYSSFTVSNPTVPGASMGGLVANGWGDNSNWADVNVTYSQETSNVHGDASAQRIDIARVGTAVSGSAVQFKQDFTGSRQIQPNRFYTMKCWMRASAPISMQVRLRTVATNVAYASQTVTLGTGWQQVIASGLGPTTATDSFWMVKTTTTVSSPVTVWMDDAELTFNQLPTVSITSPAGGATFAAPAQVPVTVNTADSDGSVAKVEFFDGTTKLGETSTAPFSFTTPALGPGAHSLTAVATDNQGATQNSSAVSITVTGPLVSVTATGPNASENGAPGVFTFTRDQTTGPLSVNYALSGTAIAGLDYVAPSGTVSFADGQSSATLTVTPLADTFIDPNDTVIATVTPGTAYGLGAPSGATVTITDTTTSPLSVVPKNPLATAPSGFGAATRSVVSVAGQGFAQALRIVTPDTSASIYEDGYSSAADIALTQPVTQGDTLVVSFWAHALTGDANGNAFLRPRIESTASVSSGERPTTVGSDWRFVRMFITMAGSYAAGGARLRIFAGYGPQTIEIGGITAVDYGRVAYSSLGLPLYEGRDLTADWRTAAAQRIDQYRKANLTVQVRDLGGNPMPGAAVHVKMKRHAFGFGSAVKATLIVSTDTSEGNYLNSQTYRDKITSIFNWIVLENELKWTSWEPADGSFNKTTPLGALAWLHDNQLSGFRGHNLIWPRWPTTEQHLPAWLQADYNSQIAANGQSAADAWLRARVLSHISGEASDVGTNVSRWDVLNEPFANHDLQDLYGRAEQAAWFQAARSAAPVGTPLVLNDYDNQGEDLPHINFLLQTLQLIDAVQPAALVDGVGIQSHLDINTMPTPDGLFANLNRYAALGKQIEITEFDIDTLGDEQLQSDVLRDYMTLSFSHPAVKAFLQWGFWAGAHYAPPKAIYNADWSPKLAANTWSDLIYHQWWTDVNTTADANGNVSLRGFQGDYDIIATTATRAVTVPTTLGAADATVTVVPREQVSVTLAPTADAYVRDGSFANTACGATDASELVVNASPANGGFNRDSYLQFDLSSVPSMFSAKLRVNAALSSVNGSTATYVVGLSACSVPSATWTESSLTWNNRPALGSVLDNANVTGAMPSPTAQWVEFDVTSWLQSEKAAGRNVVSLALHCEVQANPSIVISSREAANSALRPQLVVVTAQLPTVTVAATAPNTAELGPVPGTFTLSRTGDASVPLNISGNLGGTAIAGTDYTITGPPFNFPANAATLAVNVVPIPNDIAQGDRSVSLALQSGAAYLLGSPASASITIADKPADAWRYLTFGASANSPAIAGDLADPNHNGLANLVEYALGGDPLGNSTGLAVLPVAGRDAQGRLTLRFARYLSHSDLTLIVQGADAPAGPWADLAQSTLGSAFAPLVGGVDVSESGSGGQRTVTVSDAFALGDPVHPKRFLRLKFAR